MRVRSAFVQWAAVAFLLAGASRVSAQAAAPSAGGTDVHVVFQRPVAYGGSSHLAWMNPYPFATKLGVAVGALLRVSNVSNAPVYILGGSTDSISLGIATQEGAEWKDVALATCGNGMKPLLLAAGESFDLEVPLPAGARNMRVQIAYRTSAEPDPLKGDWQNAQSDDIDVRRWTGAGKGPAASKPAPPPKLGIAAAVHRDATPRAAEAASSETPASDVRLAFDRVVPYAGRTHEAWTSSYAFVEKRGVTVGALLHVTNTSSAPLFVLGFSRDALSVRVEAKGGSGWRGLLINETSVDLKPLPLAAGESIDLQVPLPDDLRRIRVSVVYRAANDPDWTTGGWLPAYSDAIDVRRSNK